MGVSDTSKYSIILFTYSYIINTKYAHVYKLLQWNEERMQKNRLEMCKVSEIPTIFSL